MDKHMKWFGWGNPNKLFTLDGKPFLWPFIMKIFNLPDDPFLVSSPAVKLEDIPLREPRRNEPFIALIQTILRGDQIKFSHVERVVHSYGKSFRDLWRIRRGQIDRAPDCICYPESEEDVIAVIQAAHLENVVVIPFGGGSNIAGCLESRGLDDRMVVSLDMQRMSRLISLDAKSHVARIQPGMLGPKVEAALNEQGFTLGHFPDSFEYSSVGGWVATRSAGMQSDKYGKIEDMVISLRMVTPQGTVVTRTVPKSSNGIDVRHFCIGSEGILGVITEVALQVHRLPEKKEFSAYLFPKFETGVGAIYECVNRGISPSMTRLNDPEKTALSAAFSSRKSGVQRIVEKACKFYMKRVKKFDFSKVSLLLVCFEGTKSQVKRQKREVETVYRKYGAVSLGEKPGIHFAKTKYDFPYIRDFIMDRGVIADVSETSTTWSNLMPLYSSVKHAINQAMEPAPGLCGCHISHTYQTGASLYFTFATLEQGGLEQYGKIKKAAEDTFIEGGATLSHHHAVGYEHIPWMEAEHSKPGITALQAVKMSLDPNGIMNPGKIIPSTQGTQNAIF